MRLWSDKWLSKQLGKGSATVSYGTVFIPNFHLRFITKGKTTVKADEVGLFRAGLAVPEG